MVYKPLLTDYNAAGPWDSATRGHAHDRKNSVNRNFCQSLLLLAGITLLGCSAQPQRSEQPLALKPATPAEQLAIKYSLRANEPLSEIALPSSETFWNRFRNQMSLVNQFEHPRIDKHLGWYQNNQSYFDLVMGRGNKYIYYILDKIEERNLPVELALLPIIESAFDPFAYSHSHAAGLWQFIPSTGKLYGLKKDWWYDGRRDIVAATDAALNYLTYLHELFDGDWLLALAAYNSGEGNVRRAIQRNLKTGKPADFWSLKLPRETKAYVPQLLAISKVFQNPARYNIRIDEIPNEPFFATLELSSQIDLAKAAEMAEVSPELLAELNPAFNRPVTHPQGPHRLLLPTANASTFLSSMASLPMDYWQPNKIYQVKKGDSLYTIAKQHHVTVGQLKKLNGLNSNVLQIGQRLELPGYDSNSHSLSGERQFALGSNYVVEQGDTLWNIAKRQRVSLKDLMAWNKLDKTSTLQPGQSLKLAHNAKGDDKRVKKVNYKVRRGDSLSRIASKFNLTINDILHWNRIDLQSYLTPGQRLTLFVDIRNI